MRVMATMTAAVLLAVHAIGAHAPEAAGVQGPQGAEGVVAERRHHPSTHERCGRESC